MRHHTTSMALIVADNDALQPADEPSWLQVIVIVSCCFIYMFTELCVSRYYVCNMCTWYLYTCVHGTYTHVYHTFAWCSFVVESLF